MSESPLGQNWADSWAKVGDDEAAPGPGATHPVALPLWLVVRQATGMWLATRVALIVFTYFAVPFNHHHANSKVTAFPPHSLLAAWNRWDTQWYTGIAIHGYNTRQSTGFFPLYPLLTHIVAMIIGFSNVLAAALIVSNGATLAAFIAVGLLTANEYGSRTAIVAIRALAAFPTAFFLAAGYSDSVFLALAAFSLFFARRGRWTWAALCAFAASFDRQFGLVLILPLLWEYIRQHREVGRQLRDIFTFRSLGDLLPLIAAAPAALAIWGAYLYARFGDPFSGVKAEQKYWDHVAVTPWHWLQLVVTTLQNTPIWTFPRARILFDLAPVVAVLLITVLSLQRWPFSLALYMLGVCAFLVTSAVPLDYNPFNSEGRYVLVCVPLFLLLGRWMARRPSLEMVVVGGGFMLQGLFIEFFLRGGWLV